MTKEEFYEIVESVVKPKALGPKFQDRYNYTNPKKYLQIQWETGGASGGNCWGGEAEPFYSSEREPDFRDFNMVVLYLIPAITFVQHLKMAEKLIKHSQYSETEYYGNYTDYNIKYVDLDEMYDYIVKNFLEPNQIMKKII